MDWSTAGLSSDSVYAELADYNFKPRQARLIAENAKLHFFGKLSEPVKGTFRYASFKREEWEPTHFPQFRSYFNDIQLADPGNDKLTIIGGFSVQGEQVSTEAANGGMTRLLAYAACASDRGACRWASSSSVTHFASTSPKSAQWEPVSTSSEAQAADS